MSACRFVQSNKKIALYYHCFLVPLSCLKKKETLDVSNEKEHPESEPSCCVYSEAKSGRYLRCDAVIYCQIETWRRSASPASDNGTNADLWTRDA